MFKEYETIIRSQRKSILNASYRQGCIFKKFKESDKLVEMVEEIGGSKSTIYFKIKFEIILDKYPKLKKSSLPLSFFKANTKSVKEICNESRSD